VLNTITIYLKSRAIIKNRISVFLASLPTALTALALGIASLGWCWESASNFQDQAQFSAAMLATILLLALLLKFVFNLDLLKRISHTI
jgi:exfoliative toxin A/B